MNQVEKTLDYYCHQFQTLKVDRSKGIALNKPVLLLAILELIERREITENRIELSPELVAAFLKLWSHFHIDRRADIGLPFFHLRSSGFWHFEPNPGYGLIVSPESKLKLRSLGGIREAIAYAFLDEELFELMKKDINRKTLITVLMKQWFADYRNINNVLQIDAWKSLQDDLFNQGGEVYQEDTLKELTLEDSFVRDSAFRHNVIRVYDYQCALCGIKILQGHQNIVDGCHIKPFSKFYNNKINNGISLCKNHHWAFDRFWFTITPDLSIKVSKHLFEETRHSETLKAYHKQHLSYLPQKQEHQPCPDSLDWHYQQFSQRA